MARDRNRLCIEVRHSSSWHPVGADTLGSLRDLVQCRSNSDQGWTVYTPRGIHASDQGMSSYTNNRCADADLQILTQRPDRAVLALAELCREREDELQRAPRSSSPAPRALSQPRGGFTNPAAAGGAAWRSLSQVPFDRLAPPNYESGRRGRQSEGSTMDSQDLSAQEMWLASQGSNLGNVGSLGLGFPEAFDMQGGRGRDTSARGLETPGGPYRSSRRSVSNYDHDNPGSGSISAPLSPHRLYAQLEMGKGPAAGWPAYDPRQHVSPGVPLQTGGPSTYGNRSGSNSGAQKSSARSGMLPSPSSNGGTSKGLDQPSPLPSFQPFSPPMPHSKLRQLNGEATATSFISPSTLLSPPQGQASLPGPSVDSLASDFGRMGVAPPGAGVENDQKSKGTDAVQGRQGGSGRISNSPNPERKLS